MLEPLESRLLLSTTRYVDLNSPGPAHDGASWDTAYLNPQDALAVAVFGDTIRVADGIYKPTSGTDRTISFRLKNGVSLQGAYGGYGAANSDTRDITANVTILSGDIGTVASTADNCYHVLVGSSTDSTAVLDGFAITGGNADGSGYANYSGAGMYNSAGSPTVTNCAFSGNSATCGGGMYNSGSPRLTNCTFTGNSASIYGGGMYNSSSPTLTNCSFSANSVSGPYSNGGGIYNRSSSPMLTYCSFSGNAASGEFSTGGGIYNDSSSPALIHCSFSANSSSIGGGGMFNYNYSLPTAAYCAFRGNSSRSFGGAIYNYISSSPSLTNCTFSNNSAASFGGGIYNYSRSSPTAANCRFSGNSATEGAGMYNDYYCSPALTNCTFSGNSAGSFGGAIYSRATSSPTLTNCIIRGGNSSPIYNSSSTPVISYSDIEGGYTGTGNIDADPLFVRNPSPGADTVWGTADDDYGDLRLRSGSPCIDAGSNAAVPAGITTDLASNPRFIDVPGVRDPGAIVDMGAYEYTLPLAASGSAFLLNAAKPSVKISFNGDVSAITLSAGDLLLENLTSGQPIDCSVVATVAYDPATRSATWSFAGLLADGNYRATLPAASVSDAGGNALASEFSFAFFALAGDANHDRTVDISDLGILATNWQGSGKTFSEADFNYDGIVDISDLGILATNWQKSLPAIAQPAREAIAAPSRPSIHKATRLSAVEDVGLVTTALG